MAYRYDLLGRRTKTTRGNGTTTDYAYVVDGDLDWMRHVFQGGASASVANDNWVGIDYGYDASGRMIQTATSDSRIMGALPSARAYGVANNLNQVKVAPETGHAPMSWSLAGNMKTDGKDTTFVHDGRNRLVKATKSDGTTTMTMQYAYSNDNLRIESVRNGGSNDASGKPIGGTRTRYLLSGSEEVADLDGANNIIARYIPGPAIDERVAQIDANGAISYIHTDRQNSVIAISDSAGNVTTRRAYGTYGETTPTQMTGTGGAGHPFGYTGRRWDPDLALYYYRARWYDPALGTFLETDPIGARDYVNLYSYVGVEPGNGTDPSGEQSVPVDIGIANRRTGQKIKFGTIQVPIAVVAFYELNRAIVAQAVRPESSETPSGNTVRGHGVKGTGEQYLDGKGWEPNQVDDILDAPANSYDRDGKDKYTGTDTKVHEDRNGNWVVVNGKGEVIQVNDRNNPDQPKPREKPPETPTERPREPQNRR